MTWNDFWQVLSVSSVDKQHILHLYELCVSGFLALIVLIMFLGSLCKVSETSREDFPGQTKVLAHLTQEKEGKTVIFQLTCRAY